MLCFPPLPVLPSRTRFAVVTCFVVILAAFHVVKANAQNSPDDQSDVLVKINGHSITADQVRRDMLRTLAGIKLDPVQAKTARSKTLEKLVDQRIAFEFLKKHKIEAGDDEVDLRLTELASELATVEKTIEDYLEQTNQTLEEFRFQTAWQISWQRYLDRKLTDEFLESHFQKNQRSMDGTELHVAHLLVKLPAQPTRIQKEDGLAKAKTIADQINEGALSWDAAVLQYSDAPSKHVGGEVGWIKIGGPMPPAFTREAFKLEAGETSPPVHSPFGIHLIKVLEIKQGELGWRDIIDQVRKSAANAYFEAIVDKHRPEVTIED